MVAKPNFGSGTAKSAALKLGISLMTELKNMTSYRKKLIEVALPLKAINDESSKRKRKSPAGYPTTIHKWWAQRPLAACRAVLFASLVDDPDSDPKFMRADGTVDEELAGIKRAELFNLIEELVLWENSTNDRILNKAKAEIARCVASIKIERGEFQKATIVFGSKKGENHPAGASSGEGCTAWEVEQLKSKPEIVDAFLVEFGPPVLDPFCGAGSIPLEAQRLGLSSHGSDLNPVPVMITKSLIEFPSRFSDLQPVNPNWIRKTGNEKAATTWIAARGMAEDVMHYAKVIKDKLKSDLGGMYPGYLIDENVIEERPDLAPYLGQVLPSVAWLWARSVRSSDPAASGAFVPLVTTFKLRSKGENKSWIEPVVDKTKGTYRFIVKTGQPTEQQSLNAAVGTKTARGANFRCLLTGSALDDEYIRSQFSMKKSGFELLAVVVEGKSRNRIYLPPTDEHVLIAKMDRVPSWSPEQPMDQDCSDLVSGRGYGFEKWSDLFTTRQLTSHSSFSKAIKDVRQTIEQDAIAAHIRKDDRNLANGGNGAKAYAEAISVYLSFALSRAVDYSSEFSSWRHKDSALRSTLAKQAIPMVWDFAEANPFEKSSGGFIECATVVAKCLEYLPSSPTGAVVQLDATEAVVNLRSPVVCCDPPYYSNISYAELSDFLYVWLRHSLFDVFPDIFSTLLSPKSRELVAASYRHNGDEQAAKQFFEDGLLGAFTKMRVGANQDYPVTIFYAFKQSEEDEDNESDGEDSAIVSTGWETMLQALIKSGFQISGTWPMRTEGDNRQIGVGRNALASSIVLVCRPRPDSAPLATRREFMSTLRRELPYALENLQQGNIPPVDLAQAAIGPGMAVFSLFSKVLESDGAAMSVRTALGLINQSLDEVLAEQEGEFDSDTRWAIAWFEQFGIEDGPFGDAETLSKAKNTAVNGLVEAGLIVARGGKVRLLRRDELSTGWSPASDNRLTVWEVTQHLIHRLDQLGELAAADLVNKLGGVGEVSRDLAYRLYSTCERKKWAQEALAYNSLVVAWPELTRLARAGRNAKPAVQQDLF